MYGLWRSRRIEETILVARDRYKSRKEFEDEKHKKTKSFQQHNKNFFRGK